MHHTFQRGSEQHRVDGDLWLGVLDLALVRGWAPQQQRTYARPEGLELSADDAQELGRWIEGMLPAISDQELPLSNESFGEEHTEALLSRRASGEPLVAADAQAARELLSGAPKREVEQLGAFLMGGGASVLAG